MDSADQGHGNADEKSVRRHRVQKWVGALAALALGLPGTLCCADEVDEGRSLYHEVCMGCHGRDMMNPGLAFDLRKFPKEDRERFFSSVRNGKGTGMPPWKDKLSPEDLAVLWAYVKSGG